MGTSLAHAEYVGGPLDGAKVGNSVLHDRIVVSNPRLHYWGFEYDKHNGGSCRVREMRTLGGKFHYNRRVVGGKLRYVHVRNE